MGASEAGWWRRACNSAIAGRRPGMVLTRVLPDRVMDGGPLGGGRDARPDKVRYRDADGDADGDVRPDAHPDVPPDGLAAKTARPPGGRPRAEVLGPAAGPWYTLGLGGSLLVQSAALFYGVVALVYLGFAAVLFWIFALLFGSCGTCTCDGCGNSGGGTCCDGQAEENPKEPVGCCLSSPLWMTVPLAAPRGLWSRTAHHPDHPDFAADVYIAAGRRWCIGCFTTVPAFVLTVLALGAAALSLSWPVWLAGGAILASAQAWSMLGRVRTRTAKAAVKASLGAGLGAVVHGVLTAPWHATVQVIVLFGVALSAAASAWPRARRMRAWTAG